MRSTTRAVHWGRIGVMWRSIVSPAAVPRCRENGPRSFGPVDSTRRSVSICWWRLPRCARSSIFTCMDNRSSIRANCCRSCPICIWKVRSHPRLSLSWTGCIPALSSRLSGGNADILLEIGALGVPIVAPAVGGVGELITSATGYLLSESPTANDYRVAMEAMIADPDTTDARARALVDLIGTRHTWPRFVECVRELEGYGV